ncbi:class I SAM-dependent methyltransferase [Roseovarius faecimaris]|uniref:Class I SAM-dependent methyltransferase n=1 Tax=Roseovarius faecimaris TaxID=2494550 RepID=A0A6I6IQC9_9RHOB|nr:class I SAM-dependent methyltransferase [Roseovarius faecimaris]QGX98284.1 class I SAM-dependent methyltransferase [Roseovarius faecimaris]
MSGLFDFLTNLPPYSENDFTIRRLNARHKLIIAPFRPQIEGARVLDIACHDGRWSYALAAAGAREVIGIEARQDLLDRFASFPDTPFKRNISLRQGDLFEALETLTAHGENFDVVALYGIFYHVMDHFRLLKLIRALGPRIIIVDSEFIMNDNAMIQILKEETSNPLNATSDTDGIAHTVVGVPSRKATEFMAEALGYETTWIDQALILDDEDRKGMKDYFREGRKVRGTCALTPVQ